MKVTFKRIKYQSTIYYSLTIIDVQIINTIQVFSINITMLNIFFQILHEKHTK